MIRFVHSLAEDDQELLQIQASNSWCNLDRVSTYLHNIKVILELQSSFSSTVRSGRYVRSVNILIDAKCLVSTKSLPYAKGLPSTKSLSSAKCYYLLKFYQLLKV